jgi:acetaldehyde dehydrogenase (acetylating)
VVAIVGVDSASDGLAPATTEGYEASHPGYNWIFDHADDIDVVFDVAGAYVHVRNYERFQELSIIAVDLTPAARAAPARRLRPRQRVFVGPTCELSSRHVRPRQIDDDTFDA